MASDLSLSKCPFVPLNNEGCSSLSLSRAVTTGLYSFFLWINLSECFSWPYGCGLRKDEKLAFRGGTWLLGSPMAAHCAIIAIMLYSAGAGLHQPHPAAHISALPRGVELSPAVGHTQLCPWLLCVLCCPEPVESGSKEWSVNARVILCLVQVYGRICASLSKAVPWGIEHQSQQGPADDAERAGCRAGPRSGLEGLWQYLCNCSTSPAKAACVSRCLGIKAALGKELLQWILMCAVAGKEMWFVQEQKALTVSCASLSCLMTCHGLLETGFSVHNQTWQWGNVTVHSTDTS